MDLERSAKIDFRINALWISYTDVVTEEALEVFSPFLSHFNGGIVRENVAAAGFIYPPLPPVAVDAQRMGPSVSPQQHQRQQQTRREL